ncbi:hypothetical protein [Siminovitchia sp. FSL W7-1587]|uniref:hypothetical protein n=1 Tax=Siminovitchia sp. FSL W7-1587 TaxID=2954699 RepID=UPI0030CC4207
MQHRNELVNEVIGDILTLDHENFRVRQHLQYVEKFKNRDNWQVLSVLDTNEIKDHISPIIAPFDDDEFAKRFRINPRILDMVTLNLSFS